MRYKLETDASRGTHGLDPACVTQQNTSFRFSLCHLAVTDRGEDAALVPHDGVRAGDRRRRRVRRELVEPKLRPLYMYVYMDACIERRERERESERARESVCV